MKNLKIATILESIEKLRSDMRKEYSLLQKKYGFSFQKKKVIFPPDIKKQQKKEKEGIFAYIFTANVRHVISMPFIYVIIVPAIILDIFLYMYQWAAYFFYDIPRVQRKDFFVYDRRYLAYLNIIQKINCLYCSYVNGLFAFAVEIGGRTEQYWCPIKHAKGLESEHKYFQHYADYGDSKGFQENITKNICFSKKNVCVFKKDK